MSKLAKFFRGFIAALAIAALAPALEPAVAAFITGDGGGGGTPGGSDTQVQFNDSGAFGGDSGLVFNKTTNALTGTGLWTITQGSANTGVLASTGYSLTGSNATNMIDLAGTWNTSGVPDVLKANITATAVGSGANFLNFQYGGSKRAQLSAPNGATSGISSFKIFGDNGTSATYMQMYMDSGGESGGFSGSTNSVGEQFILQTTAVTNGARFALGALGQITFQSTNRTDSGSIDTAITRNAAGVVQIGTSGTANASGQLLAAVLRTGAVAFASLPGSPVEGMMVAVNDSSTATWGATITGGGANHVLAYYNGTNWTVAAK